MCACVRLLKVLRVITEILRQWLVRDFKGNFLHFNLFEVLMSFLWIWIWIYIGFGFESITVEITGTHVVRSILFHYFNQQFKHKPYWALYAPFPHRTHKDGLHPKKYILAPVMTHFLKESIGTVQFPTIHSKKHL